MSEEELRAGKKEDLDEVSELNHDMVFIYKDKSFFLSFGKNDAGKTVRGLFKWPGGWEPIELFDGISVDDVKLDGKTLYELIDDITITDLY